MIDPVNPTTAENASSSPYCTPVCEYIARSSPRSFSTTDSTSTTARFVPMKRMMRFISGSFREEIRRPAS